MRRQVPFNVTVYYPQSPGGKQELSRRVAEVHADAVIAELDHLPCPDIQKLALLDAVIAAGI